MLTIKIEGSTVEEVRLAVLALADTMGGEHIAAVRTQDDPPTAEVDTAAPKRGRKSKAAAEASAAAQEDEAGCAETPEAPAAASANVVKDMPPAEARAEGIRLMQAYFASNPNSMPEITKIQQKFGVKMFSDITDAKAGDFLADVRLVTSGTPIAA